MEFLVSELSAHGQFESSDAFVRALGGVLACRAEIRRLGAPLLCDGRLQLMPVMNGVSFGQAVARIPDRNRRMDVLTWIAKSGPFWPAERRHGEDDLYELSGEGGKLELITESSIAEAAARCAAGHDSHVVSLIPSRFIRTPLSVRWTTSLESGAVEIRNFWEAATIGAYFELTERPVECWEQVLPWARRHCLNIVFADNFTLPMVAGHLCGPQRVGCSNCSVCSTNTRGASTRMGSGQRAATRFSATSSCPSRATGRIRPRFLMNRTQTRKNIGSD